MTFLSYDISKERVICSDDGFALKEVMTVYKNDRHGSNKDYFNAIVTAIYFIYKPGGIYWNKPIQERIHIVNSDHLKEHRWEVIREGKGVKELIEKYIDLTYTINERLLDGIKRDSLDLLKLLNDIPVSYEEIITKNSEIKDHDGIMRKVSITKTVEFPNTEKKVAAYEAILLLTKNLKQIEENLKIEYIEKQRSESERRIFDNKTE